MKHRLVDVRSTNDILSFSNDFSLLTYESKSRVCFRKDGHEQCCNHSHIGSRAKTVVALFIPVFAMLVTSRMPLYVMLLSLYVGQMSLYGCGSGCDGEKYKTCVTDATPAEPSTDAAQVCKDSQATLDCAKGMCDCTCKDMQESGGDACPAGDDVTMKDSTKAAVAAMNTACTGDNAVTDPCA